MMNLFLKALKIISLFGILSLALKITSTYGLFPMIFLGSMMWIIAKIIFWLFTNRNNLLKKIQAIFVTISYGLIEMIKSFLQNALSFLFVIAVLIGGLWLVAKILNLIPMYILVFAFVAFVIYACIVGPPPPPPPPPKGTGVQRMWIGIHQDQLEALEREREELLEEIDDLRRDRDCIDTGYGIIIPNCLSDSEREYNIRRRDELDGKIRDKEWELSELENKIQSKRREVMNELDDLED